jgi:hypothetical protein
MSTSSDLAAILARIQKRLAVLGMSEHAASKAAGKESAIRNLRRAIGAENRQGVSTSTLAALAPVLKTTTAWLLSGEGQESVDPEEPNSFGWNDGANNAAGEIGGKSMPARISSEQAALFVDVVAAYLGAYDPRLAEEWRRASHAAAPFPIDLDWNNSDRNTLLEEASLQGQRARLRSK